jgi:hypothetical protein
MAAIEHNAKYYGEPVPKRRLRVGLVCAWYDFWFGLFFDPKKRILYAMIPFIGLKFWIGPTTKK